MKILQKDWRYTVAQVQNKVYINKVGTFGIASAQYYWGRMAAIAIRLLYHIFPTEGWYFVYVDDFFFILPPEDPWARAAAHGRVAGLAPRGSSAETPTAGG